MNTKFIGCKGIGFKSVFKVTYTPIIHSGQYSFHFDSLALNGLGYLVPFPIPLMRTESMRESPLFRDREFSNLVDRVQVAVGEKKVPDSGKRVSQEEDPESLFNSVQRHARDSKGRIVLSDPDEQESDRTTHPRGTRIVLPLNDSADANNLSCRAAEDLQPRLLMFLRNLSRLILNHSRKYKIVMNKTSLLHSLSRCGTFETDILLLETVRSAISQQVMRQMSLEQSETETWFIFTEKLISPVDRGSADADLKIGFPYPDFARFLKKVGEEVTRRRKQAERDALEAAKEAAEKKGKGGKSGAKGGSPGKVATADVSPGGKEGSGEGANGSVAIPTTPRSEFASLLQDFDLPSLIQQVSPSVWEQQQVFAWLPTRSYGLKFVLQADWIVSTSREALIATDSFNQFVRDEVPRSFGRAAKEYVLLVKNLKKDPAIQNLLDGLKANIPALARFDRDDLLLLLQKYMVSLLYTIIPLPGSGAEFFARTPLRILEELQHCEFVYVRKRKAGAGKGGDQQQERGRSTANKDAVEDAEGQGGRSGSRRNRSRGGSQNRGERGSGKGGAAAPVRESDIVDNIGSKVVSSREFSFSFVKPKFAIKNKFSNRNLGLSPALRTMLEAANPTAAGAGAGAPLDAAEIERDAISTMLEPLLNSVDYYLEADSSLLPLQLAVSLNFPSLEAGIALQCLQKIESDFTDLQDLVSMCDEIGSDMLLQGLRASASGGNALISNYVWIELGTGEKKLLVTHRESSGISRVWLEEEAFLRVLHLLLLIVSFEEKLSLQKLKTLKVLPLLLGKSSESGGDRSSRSRAPTGVGQGQQGIFEPITFRLGSTEKSPVFDSEFAVSLSDVQVLHPKFKGLIYSRLGRSKPQQQGLSAAAYKEAMQSFTVHQQSHLEFQSKLQVLLGRIGVQGLGSSQFLEKHVLPILTSTTAPPPEHVLACTIYLKEQLQSTGSGGQQGSGQTASFRNKILDVLRRKHVWALVVNDATGSAQRQGGPGRSSQKGKGKGKSKGKGKQGGMGASAGEATAAVRNNALDDLLRDMADDSEGDEEEIARKKQELEDSKAREMQEEHDETVENLFDTGAALREGDFDATSTVFKQLMDPKRGDKSFQDLINRCKTVKIRSHLNASSGFIAGGGAGAAPQSIRLVELPEGFRSEFYSSWLRVAGDLYRIYEEQSRGSGGKTAQAGAQQTQGSDPNKPDPNSGLWTNFWLSQVGVWPSFSLSTLDEGYSQDFQDIVSILAQMEGIAVRGAVSYDFMAMTYEIL